MIGFYLFRLLEFILFLLPGKLRKAFFSALADLAYAVDKKHRQVIRQNLEFAFNGELDKTKIESIGRYCYKNLALTLLQVMEGRRLSKEELASKVTFVHGEIVEKVLNEEQPIIFVSGHYGNWELGATALSALITPTTSIHKALNNPYFDRYLHESRSHFDLTLAEKHGAVKKLTKALKQGRCISLMIDQNINPKEGIVVDFFGKRATQTAAPAFLARKYGAVIIPLLITTEDDEHHRITFYEPIEVAKTDNAEADVHEATQKQSHWLQEQIKENPKFWFWCHRRWKAEYPEIYSEE